MRNRYNPALWDLLEQAYADDPRKPELGFKSYRELIARLPEGALTRLAVDRLEQGAENAPLIPLSELFSAGVDDPLIIAYLSQIASAHERGEPLNASPYAHRQRKGDATFNFSWSSHIQRIPQLAPPACPANLSHRRHCEGG